MCRFRDGWKGDGGRQTLDTFPTFIFSQIWAKSSAFVDSFHRYSTVTESLKNWLLRDGICDKNQVHMVSAKWKNNE